MRKFHKNALCLFKLLQGSELSCRVNFRVGFRVGSFIPYLVEIDKVTHVTLFP